MVTSIRHSSRRGSKMALIDFRRDPTAGLNWVMGHARAGKDRIVQKITDAGFRFVEQRPVLRSNYFLVLEKLPG